MGETESHGGTGEIDEEGNIQPGGSGFYTKKKSKLKSPFYSKFLPYQRQS